jgi:hypothetical protein
MWSSPIIKFSKLLRVFLETLDKELKEWRIVIKRIFGHIDINIFHYFFWIFYSISKYFEEIIY